MSPTVALLLVSLIWGGTFVSVKQALADASPLLFVAVRFALGAAASMLLLRRSGGLIAALKVGIPIGAVLGAAYAAQTLGLVTTTPARSAFITGLSVPLVSLWAWLLWRQRPTPLQLWALAVTLLGGWLLTIGQSFDSTGLASFARFLAGWNQGDSWTLLCAALYGLHVPLITHFGARVDAAGLLVFQLVTTAVLALGASFAVEEVHFRPSSGLIFAIVFTGLLATTLTNWLQIRYQPRTSPTRAAFVFATEPLFAAAFSLWLYGERLPATSWFGGGLIVCGMVLAELPVRARATRGLS